MGAEQDVPLTLGQSFGPPVPEPGLLGKDLAATRCFQPRSDLVGVAKEEGQGFAKRQAV